MDRITELLQKVEGLFAAIAHGDDEHRAWLKEAIDNHFAGLPVPSPRGQGTKEAENERLRNDNPILKREIERLWAALLELSSKIERLNGEKQRGHVQSGEDEFGKRGRNEPEKP